MTSPFTLELTITYIALLGFGALCFVAILSFWQHAMLNWTEFWTLTTFGGLSAIAQFWLTYLIAQSFNPITLVLPVATTAFILYAGVVILIDKEKLTGREGYQAILWGELVFPLVLITLLPEGFHTLLKLF